MMHNRYCLLVTTALWTVFSYTAYAKDIPADQVPKEISDKFQQNYPDAKEVQAETVTHFNTPLIKITFKKGDEPEVEYYRPNGSKFVNGFNVDEDEIPLEVQQSLKKEFSAYKVKAATLIANPNGVGREYEIDLTSGAGANWEYIANENGTILTKTPD